MIVNIIDREFNFLGQIDSYESLILGKSYHGVLGFELHINENTTNAFRLQKENIIFTTPKKTFVILHREISSTDGKLIIKGLELKSYLKRWSVFPPAGQAYYRVNANIETIMKEYVQATLVRKGVTNIEVASNKNRGITTVYQTRYKNLADELEKLSLIGNLGWDITLDIENKKFIFDVVESKDRSANQDILPPAIFSVEYDNIAEQRLIDSRINYSNVAIVAGQGEGAARAITIIGDAEGLDAFELFVDARDIENTDDLSARGEQKLSELKEIFTFDSRVLTDKNLRYEKDFNLGDIATVQNKKWNITVDRRITEITEIYESSGFRLDVLFGENLPTTKDLIKQATDIPIVEGGGSGEPGIPGSDGVGLDYNWNGTQLGVKREDESIYQYTNLIGAQGPKGDKGDTGSQGLQGIQGIQGVKGDTGAKGDKGDRGDIGERGLQGEKGDKGDKGDSGPKGDTGVGIPVGGTLGQVLQKKSSTNYDTQWVNAAGTKIISGASEPAGLVTGDQWHKEY